jgi:hypothetical protein
MEMNFSSYLKSKRLIFILLWAAHMISILILGAIAYFVISQTAKTPNPEQSLPIQIFTALASMAAVGGQALQRFLLTEDRLRALLRKDARPEDLALNPQTKQIDQNKLKQLLLLRQDELKLLRFIEAHLVPSLLVLAANESVAIFGFVAAHTAKSFDIMIPFAAAALGLNLFALPRFDRWLEQGRMLLRTQLR